MADNEKNMPMNEPENQENEAMDLQPELVEEIPNEVFEKIRAEAIANDCEYKVE